MLFERAHFEVYRVRMVWISCMFFWDQWQNCKLASLNWRYYSLLWHTLEICAPRAIDCGIDRRKTRLPSMYIKDSTKIHTILIFWMSKIVILHRCYCGFATRAIFENIPIPVELRWTLCVLGPFSCVVMSAVRLAVVVASYGSVIWNWVPPRKIVRMGR